jgi:hypothetical protein
MASRWSSDHDAPPSPPGIPPDPAAATGPPWPRLIAPGVAHSPPRMARWPIVAGIVLVAGWIAATAGLHAASAPSPRPASGYLLTASDAHFTATFPRKPLRIEKTAGTTTVIVYLADLPGYAVEIIRAPVPASGSLSLDRAVNVAASALPGGGVVSRHSITYHGQPAEDAVISVLGDPGQIRVVAFGSSAYIFEGIGSTAASFAHDYKVLLDSFRLLHP